MMLAPLVAASAGNPVAKVIQLLGKLQNQIVQEGEVEQQQYEKFVDWCQDNAKDLQHELTNSAGRKEDLAATVEKANSDIEVDESTIGDLTTAIAEAEADLDKASQVRKSQHANWSERDAELAETIDTLERDLSIVKQESAKGLMQLDKRAIGRVTAALTVLLDASSIETASKTRLQAFMQTQMDDDDDDAPKNLGAIIEILSDMLEKAESQRSDARKAETERTFNFEQLKLSLEQKSKSANKNLRDTKHHLASVKEVLATAEGDLADAEKDHSSDASTLQSLQTDCMVKASDHETSVSERNEELKALAVAKKTIEDKTGGASDRAYGLIQTNTKSDDIMRVVSKIRALSRKTEDFKLALLSSQVSSAVQSSLASGGDPFGKVKGLIEKMIQRLLDDAKAEAGHKAYCDKEMGETESKKMEHEEDLDHLSAKIRSAESSTAKLGAEIAELEAELGSIAQSQKEMDTNRHSEHEEFLSAKKEYEDGVEGIQMAIKVLKEYYGSALMQQPAVGTHSAAGGESSGIIGLLEVAESDFTKLLAEVEADEKDAQDSYDKQTKANKLAKAEKETSLDYTNKELKETESALAELRGDKESESSELDAVLDYYSKIKKQCVAKPDSYEVRKQRREAEIEGLKNALDILENQAVSFLAVRASLK
jgi:hypothetical protein